MEHSGYRFYPTASEGLTFLLRFVEKQEMNDSGFITTNIDVYGGENPWKIYSQGVPSGGLGDDNNHSYRYFITKKSNLCNGCWKQQGEEKPILVNVRNSSSPVTIGRKKTMHYEHKFGHWLMKEYQLSQVILGRFDEDRRDYVLCAIKKEYMNDCYCSQQAADEEDG